MLRFETLVALLILSQKEYFENLRTLLIRDCATHRRTIDCHQLGEFYQSVERNYEEAGKIFKELCAERSHSASCLQAGILHVSGRGLQMAAMPDVIQVFH